MLGSRRTKTITKYQLIGTNFEKSLEWAIRHKDDPPYNKDEFEEIPSKTVGDWNTKF